MLDKLLINSFLIPNQLLMFAPFNNPTTLHHKNLICILDSAQPMCNHNHIELSTLDQLIQRKLHFMLTLRV